MNTRYLNTCVNLPKFCSKRGLTGLTFTRLPSFGWYASDGTKVFNLFDLYTDPTTAYKDITTNHTDCLDFKLDYSGLADSLLKQDLKQHADAEAIYAESVKLAETSEIRYKNRWVKLGTLLDEAGAGGLRQLGAGLLAHALTEKYPNFPWNVRDLNRSRKFLLPSYCAPGKICSLKTCLFEDIFNCVPRLSYGNARLWIDGEDGWYGQLNKRIVPDVQSLSTIKGCLWNYKVDYWTDKLDLVNTFTPAEIGRIWVEAPRLRHTIPVEVLKQASLETALVAATAKDIKEYQELTGIPTLTDWLQSRERTHMIGLAKILQRDHSYYLLARGGEQVQITNFIFEPSAVVSGKTWHNQFVWGHMILDDHTIPMAFSSCVIQSPVRLTQQIRQQFVKLGLPIPYIHENYYRYLGPLFLKAAQAFKPMPPNRLPELQEEVEQYIRARKKERQLHKKHAKPNLPHPLKEGEKQLPEEVHKITVPLISETEHQNT